MDEPSSFFQEGEVCICMYYCKLNKRSTKDALPLPLPGEVQNHLVGSKVFTKLYLQCEYSEQVPINRMYEAKTAFIPGPHM